MVPLSIAGGRLYPAHRNLIMVQLHELMDSTSSGPLVRAPGRKERDRARNRSGGGPEDHPTAAEIEEERSEVVHVP